MQSRCSKKWCQDDAEITKTCTKMELKKDSELKTNWCEKIENWSHKKLKNWSKGGEQIKKFRFWGLRVVQPGHFGSARRDVRAKGGRTAQKREFTLNENDIYHSARP